ncbi:hypothetical protein PB2503_11294 [Parvularcula bermudensis HTCC2503]|uniref:Spore protein YkvP/CgeB glycosyl transferase-like domain-containing protein n=1 Tax=Parvularcula bermudensis (strain ATCC BAA-594 / HTCC2503 / KCTC 12087) TaxID=314260 RepID=E0TC48_PARBH|nr:glycosyltransferase [Parvularcula bermudensis]ADM10306.1 hypothetical protein PB2503_11294 [Parvularcula bermudensis HTCC2503]
MSPDQEDMSPLRILAVSRTHSGANDYAFVRAFRRAGHSVETVNPAEYIPGGWNSLVLRAVRRVLEQTMVETFNRAILAAAENTRPHLLFVFKGQWVRAETLDKLRGMGIVTINFYPDTGFRNHGRYLPDAIARYDWVFTTKSFGVDDLRENYGMPRSSYIDHGFDPEVHRPHVLSPEEERRYGCDVVFVGSRTPKKEGDLAHLIAHRPDLHYRIWGGCRWSFPIPPGARVDFGGILWGAEYAKALRGGKVALALLYEGDPGAPAPDNVTARTFEIPAAGGVMLHERTSVVADLFNENVEAVFFDDRDDLVAKVSGLIDAEATREAIATAGRQKVVDAAYSVDHRVAHILDTYRQCAADLSSESRRRREGSD